MTQQVINAGTSTGDGTGEALHTAFVKVNANFAELYGAGYQTASQVSTAVATAVSGEASARADADALLAPLASPTFSGTVTIPVGASITGYATSSSPALTGSPTAPTAAGGTNTTQLATTAFVRSEVAALVNSAPGALDTLGEIATQLASDESAAAALTTAVGLKAPIASPTFTGTVTLAATPSANDNSLKAATTAYSDRPFTRTTPGAAPASGGTTGTANFLREDGTWAVPPGSGGSSRTIGTASAAGTTQGTATALTTDDTVVTTVASGTGVLLRATNGQVLLNRGANTLNVYPPTGGAIEGAGTNTAATIPAGSSATFNTADGVQFYAR